MANDIPDYSSSVVVQSGSVTINGTANVQVTNTPSVTISGTPSVTVSSGTVSIGNTPSVVISGTPTVILGGGVATIGAVSAINSTVTVAGTINIGNTPSVSISGTPTVNIGNTPSVTIASGTVTISGTVTVAVSGNVNIGTTPGPADVTAGPSALGALNAAVSVATAGLQGVGMLLAAGTLVGTIVPEVSMDGGSTWVGSTFINPVDQTTATSIVFGSANTVTTRSVLTPAGTTNARIRVSAYTSGTAQCTLKATAAQSLNILIAGTPTVNIGNTPSVSISGTPNVNISSGTVSISGTPNINISGQSITVGVNAPPTALANLSFPANVRSTQTTGTVPAGAHALHILNTGSVASLGNVVITGHQTGVQYFPFPTDGRGSIPQITLYQNYDLTIPIDSTSDTTFDITATNPSATTAVSLHVTAILDASAVWVQNSLGTPIYVAGLYGHTSQSQVGSADAVAVAPQPYDVTGFSAPAVSVQATVTLAASAGKAYRCHVLAGSLGNSAAAGATAQDLMLLDGGATIFQIELRIVATAGAWAAFGLSNLAYKGTAGNSMTVKLSAAQANDVERVNIGAYLQ